MYESIFRNIPNHPDWVGSFYERLVEDATWDRDEFWKLHLALVNAGNTVGLSTVIDRELAFAAAKIQSRVLGAVAAHYDSNDIFLIKNLTPDQLHEFIERFDHAIIGVFSGEVLAESSYDLNNPLIAGT